MKDGSGFRDTKDFRPGCRVPGFQSIVLNTLSPLLKQVLRPAAAVPGNTGLPGPKDSGDPCLPAACRAGLPAVTSGMGLYMTPILVTFQLSTEEVPSVSYLTSGCAKRSCRS